jgi:glycosyltransferase involved in cell wall biosynthesis
VGGHRGAGERSGPGARPGAAARALTFGATAAGADGSGYYRLLLPWKHLSSNSRHLAFAPKTSGELPSRDVVEGVDAFVAQRPVGPMGMRMWDALEGATARVYEVDDDLLTADSSALEHLCEERVRDSIRYMLERSEMVTVSTPYLAELYSQYNRNVRVLPNFINADVLDLNRRRGREGKVTVGWAGGNSHMPDWSQAHYWIRPVLQRYAATVDMHFVGKDYSPHLHHPDAVPLGALLWTSWTDDIWDYYRGIDFDIGLAPLADIPFNYSKSHLKALEYAALGIPVIATDMEPYRDFVVDGVTGYLVSSPEQWDKRLSELINDAAAREEMGAAARKRAAEFTIQGNWQLWESAYTEAAHGA